MNKESVSSFKEPYIIAETAYNHEGDISYLYQMIDDIAEVGLNAIKFHMLLNLDSYIRKDHPHYGLFAKWMFSEKDWNGIIDYSREKELEIVALCDDVESVNYIVSNNKPVKAIELHATGLNDYFLLEAVSKYNGQVILGIGGSTLDEIQYAVDFLKQRGGSQILLMYGYQSYPTKYQDINLSKMIKIREKFNLPVGYADHTAFDDPYNEIVSVMGAMMGVNVLEKHYTPDYGVERIDYHSAVGKEKMKKIKELMKLVVAVRGGGGLGMSDAETEYGGTGFMKKAIVARENINKGDKLSLSNLWFKRTNEKSNIRQNQISQFIGLEVAKNIRKDEMIDFTKVKGA